jgi:hypothetical protein
VKHGVTGLHGPWRHRHRRGRTAAAALPAQQAGQPTPAARAGPHTPPAPTAGCSTSSKEGRNRRAWGAEKRRRSGYGERPEEQYHVLLL